MVKKDWRNAPATKEQLKALVAGNTQVLETMSRYRGVNQDTLRTLEADMKTAKTRLLIGAHD